MTEPNVLAARPARILMYTAYLAPKYSGAALQALTLAHELRQRGHHIEFVTNRWPGLAEDAVIEGFRVRRLEPGRLQKHREFRLWFNLARYVHARRHDFDVLHSHGAYYTHSFLGPLAKALGLRSIVKASLANDDLHGLANPLVGRLHRLMLGRIDGYIGISQDLVNEFLGAGMDPQKVHHLPNGVDTARFRPPAPQAVPALRQALGLPAGQSVALYVGVLDERKNILWLAEQWVASRGFGTGALLLAVGPQSRDDGAGVLRNRLAELARAHPDSFALHGFSTDVLGYYQAVDLLVLPSVNEGLPNVVLEAMACGLPCVAARTSGSRELVIEGATGCTYPPADVHTLGEAVRHVLSPDGAEMGRQARRVAEQRYAIGQIASQYTALYAGMLAQDAPRRAPLQPVRRQAGPPPPRRVVFVENGIGYGGAVTCLRHLVRALDPARYEPIVITGQSDGPYAGIAEDARWLSIPDRRVDVIGVRRRIESWTWIRRLPGLRWLMLQSIARLDDLVNFLPLVAQLTWALLRIRPDIVHANNEPLCNRAAVIAARLLRLPLVSHVRGDQFGSRSMAALFRLPHQFIPVSRWIANSIAQVGVPADRSTLIYDGIDFSKLDPLADSTAFRTAHGIAPQALTVGLPGVLISWKGQGLFLEAVRLLAPEFPTMHFLVVGGTPDECKPFERELRDFVEQHGLQARVTFTGHVEDMSTVYSALDVVVSASTSPEPLGMVVVEAMAMQRAVVAPSHGGALEVVEHGQTGLLFAPGDAAALAAEIRRVALDPHLRQRLAGRGRDAVMDRFSIVRGAMEVQRVYDHMLAGAR